MWLFLAIFALLADPALALMPSRRLRCSQPATRTASSARMQSGGRSPRTASPGGSYVKLVRKRGRGSRMVIDDAGAGEPPLHAILNNGATPGGDGIGGPVLVLGAGWVGSRLAESLLEEGTSVFVTHRPRTELDKKPPYFRPISLDGRHPPATRLAFEMSEPESWANLPPPESLGAVVVTFALSAAPEEFWEQYLGRVPNVVCYSSTSVYQVDKPGQVVDEQTPVKPAGRAAAEAYVLERGASLLTISGIFGERRSSRGICTCLSTYTSAGGVLNGNKRVNMVHVDDIIAASLACISSPRPRERINVAGHHFLLSQLISHCKHPPVPDGPDTDLSSKCVCSEKLLTKVMPEGYDFVQPLEAPAASPLTNAAAAA